MTIGIYPFNCSQNNIKNFTKLFFFFLTDFRHLIVGQGADDLIVGDVLDPGLILITKIEKPRVFDHKAVYVM